MRSITILPKLDGAPVLIRVDYNVPMKNGKVVDPRRIEASYRTIDAVIKKGGTPIVIAHLGDGSESLRPVATLLSKRYGIVFIDRDIADKTTHTLIGMVPPKTVILLENIRRYPGEEKNAAAFAKTLASYGQYYINDAFSVSHRTHASVVGIPKYLPSFAGYQLELEIKALSVATGATKHPFVFILGGAKFSTKIPLLAQYAGRADSIVIAGAILNNFYKVAGFEVGNSVVESGYDKPIKALLNNPKLLLPIDVIVDRARKARTVSVDEVTKGDIIVDIGPRSVGLIAQKIAKAKLVVWNGPTGWYEKGYKKGTVGVAKAIAGSNARAIIGGGDTGAVIEKVIRLPALPAHAGQAGESKHIFVSTGGGAALDFLAKGTLPGIDALQ